MKKEALLALAVFVLCWGVCYPWTTPAKVNPSGYSGPACARNVTPTSEAVQQDGTSKVRVLHNWGVPALGAPYFINEALSTDGGTHWTSWNTVYYDPNLSQYSPSLVRVGNVLHATWYQVNASNKADIFYARSTDFGATWTVIQPVLWQNQISMLNPSDEFPHLAVSDNGQKVVIVWTQSPSTYPTQGPPVNVWSTDGGQSWNSTGPTKFLPSPLTNAYQTNVTYSPYNGGRFIAVYSMNESPYNRIWSIYSTDGGANWTGNTVVNSLNGNRNFPVVVSSTGIVMCVWRYFVANPVTLSSNTSTDGGTTWSPSEQFFPSTYPSNDPTVSPWPSLTCDASAQSFLCAWASTASGSCEIYASENFWALPNWSTVTQVTYSLNRLSSHGPRISRYPGSGQSNRYITFANGNTASNLTIWESESNFIPFGGGGQSKGVAQRSEEDAPMVRVKPNPANEFARISYSLGKGKEQGVLKVYSITGQLVKTLSLVTSAKELIWNLKDESGKPVANGVYLLRLDGSDVHLSERMVVLR